MFICSFQTSVFIVCFSLNSRASFDNISRKWLPELRTNSPKVPVLLVGECDPCMCRRNLNKDECLVAVTKSATTNLFCYSALMVGLSEHSQLCNKSSFSFKLCSGKFECVYEHAVHLCAPNYPV